MVAVPQVLVIVDEQELPVAALDTAPTLSAHRV
jgi:hypothetical protein